VLFLGENNPLQPIYTAEITTPEPALSGSEGARNDREGSHHEAQSAEEISRSGA